ncbi:FtsH protease activity modulator HflK [Paenibacillus harenae]|uniref:FtsH protease activity modulator HflK n=1 Tax=Paenibacillus harenae TaxID=306543 RepID=UPI002792FB74|nr:FtsH protease activity modulator HflK [Paenibacillus harenae]MDQ0060648.1 membrane protease subunit HflK [Paenibacillus harenae]
MDGNPNVQRNDRKPQPLKPGTAKKAILIAVAAIVVIYLGFSSFYTVQEQERAAILTFGKYTSEETAGLHFKWPYPIQEVIMVKAELTQRIHIGYRQNGDTVVPVEEEALMITGDENIVSADAVVQWKISNIHDYLYNIDDPEQFLRNAASSSIRSVIGSEKLDYAITDGKTVIQDKVREKLLELQTKYKTGIQIIDIKFQDIEPPSGQVEEAFREVTNAREEKNTKINNAVKYENDRIPKARGEAQALLENAEGEKKSRVLNAEGDVAKFNAIYNEYKNNPNVTQSRLILETLEKILPNAQIFITNSNSDTVNYLPLNELLKGGNGTAKQTETTSPVTVPQQEPQGGDAQ